MVRISLLTQFYGQPKLLAAFVANLRDWPAEVAGRCELVVVDDCGSPPVLPEDLDGLEPMGVQLLRHVPDVPWAQPCCRNLAADHAKGDVLIMLDPDMMIPRDRAAAFVEAAEKLPRGEVIRFVLREVNHPNKAKNHKVNLTSPNCWILHRPDFLAVGGYNEEFAGHKGYSDVELLHTLECAYDVRQDRNLQVDFHRRSSVIPDADVQTLDREVKTNHAIHSAHREEVRRKHKGNWASWVKKTPPRRRHLAFRKLR